MRVLVLSSLFPSNASPTSGIFIKEQLNEIRKLCTIACIISPTPWVPPIKKLRERSKDNKRPEIEQWEDVMIYRPRYFMIPKLTVYLNGFLYFISVYFFLKKKKIINFDIIHVHFAYPAGFVGALLGKILRKAVILTVRGTDINYFPRDPVLKIFIKYALKNTGKVIAVSESLRKRVLDIGVDENKITVIPNGVDLKIFKPASKQYVRKKLGLSSKSNVILYVGALEKVKGPEYLLKAFKEIYSLKAVSEPLLVLIGSGSLYESIKRMLDEYDIRHCVLMKDYIAHEEIPLWMNASDVFCLASLNEGRPNVLYEAMACGLPVIATAVGGIPEILICDQLGMLVPSKSIEDIKNAIIMVLSKSYDAQSIRDYALPHSVTFYSKKILDEYHACLRMH